MLNKVLVWVLGVVILVSCAAAPNTPGSLSASIEERTTQIECRSSEGFMLGYGSATKLDGRLALSAAHVGKSCNEMGGQMYIGDELVTVLKMGEGVDLMLVWYFGTPIERAVLAYDNPPVGTHITIWGYPSVTYTLIATRGIISGVLGQYLLTDSLSTFGNSGGGVWDDKDRLVAVLIGGIWQRDSLPYGLSVVVPAEQVQEFLKDTLWIH